jgi:mono/diheme cytochrome c family protein
MTPRSQAALLLAALAGVSLVALPGCRGDRSNKPPRQFFPDMDDAPKYKPQTAAPFFTDHRSMRPAVAGTVAFGRFDFAGSSPGGAGPEWMQPFSSERAQLLKDDDRVFRGVEGTNPEGGLVYVAEIPVPVTEALLARGQERFGIYCAACHGYFGRGEGTVGQRWTGQTVANLMDPKYSNPQEPDQKGHDGFLFHTAMNGVWDPATGAQKMPPYSHALSAEDAWGIVAYIRVLQAAQGGRLEDVPEPRRSQIAAELAKLPPAPPQGAGTTNQPAGQQPTSNVPSGSPPVSTPPTPPTAPPGENVPPRDTPQGAPQ